MDTCENRYLIDQGRQNYDGSTFELFGRTFRRQSRWLPGNMVLVVKHGTRTYLNSDGSLMLRDGEIVSEPFSRLGVVNTSKPFTKLFSPDGSGSEPFVTQDLIENDYGARFEILGVLCNEKGWSVRYGMDQRKGGGRHG